MIIPYLKNIYKENIEILDKRGIISISKNTAICINFLDNEVCAWLLEGNVEAHLIFTYYSKEGAVRYRYARPNPVVSKYTQEIKKLVKEIEDFYTENSVKFIKDL